MSSCGGQPQPEEDQPPVEPAQSTSKGLCIRCKGARPAVIHIRVSYYCQECFLDVFLLELKKGVEPARIRSRDVSTREKKRAISEGKKRGKNERSSILLAFSGGASSRALMHTIKTFFPPPPAVPNPKYIAPPIFAGIEVAYVDESGVPGFGHDRTDEVRKIVESEGFKFVPLKLEDVMSSETASFSLDPSSSGATTSLVLASVNTDHSASQNSSPPPIASTSSPQPAPLSSLLSLLAPHSPTSRTSLHTSLLHSLLRQTALKRGHSILLTGETANRLAIKLISGMSEGRGYNAGEEVGAYWESDGGEGEGDLMVVRPLALSVKKQVAFYNQVMGLESLTMEKPGTKVEAKKAGIEALIEEFVTGLEVNFPSTVSTIIRTGGKLGMRSVDAQERDVSSTPCPLCGLPAQVGAQEWRTSITVSSLVDPASTSAEASSETLPTQSHALPLSSMLCYGCLLVFESSRQAAKSSEGGANVVLPPYVGEAAERRWKARDEDAVGVRVKDKGEVEKEISEYLL